MEEFSIKYLESMCDGVMAEESIGWSIEDLIYRSDTFGATCLPYLAKDKPLEVFKKCDNLYLCVFNDKFIEINTYCWGSDNISVRYDDISIDIEKKEVIGHDILYALKLLEQRLQGKRIKSARNII